MAEYSSLDESDIADDLLDLIPRLLREIRADIPREASAEQVIPELRDISELRATTGQIRLLRIVITHQRCTMQELAEQLDVAAPTVTAMPKMSHLSCLWFVLSKVPGDGEVSLLLLRPLFQEGA